MTPGAAKQRSTRALDEWKALFLANGQALPVLRQRTAFVDELILEAWAATLGAAQPEGVSLLAVGGYGRRELFPFSDIDLLILVRRPMQDPAAREQLSEFLRILWDGGLRVSQSVRTPEECAALHEGNLELTVSLLDERLLGGDPVLYGLMRERFARFLSNSRRDLQKRLAQLARSRHARFHDTIHRLEPDVKEAPGGLRDLQVSRWLRRLRDAGNDPADDPRPFEFVSAVRCFLHFLAGRDQNVLSFEAQDEIVSAPFSPWKDPAEWMRNYFRHASRLYRGALIELETAESQDRPLLAQFRDWRSRLSNSDFTVSRDLVFLKNPHELDTDADLPLRLFRFVGRHGVSLARQTEHRLTSHLTEWARQYESSPPPASFWREFLSQPYAVEALRAMSATGFLSTVLPEWDHVDHLVVRDFYHQYTVDEHTLVTIDVLQELSSSTDPSRTRFKDLLEESANDLWMLRFALLLHDLGKGTGHEHTAESVRLAQEITRRSSFEVAAAEVVHFLIEKHLILSSILQGKDLVDPRTAQLAAGEVRTIERLRLLTLLTYADISAVNPSAMTPWRMEQLWRLYRITARELSRELTDPVDATPQSAYGDVPATLAVFLSGLPARYIWTHDRAQAEAHCGLYAKAREQGVALSIDKKEGVYRLSILAGDRPFLFASLAGALSSFGLNILKAEAFSNAHGYIVDGFIFSDPTSSLDLNPPELERLRQTLKKVALGEVRAEDLLKHRPVHNAPSRLAAIQPAVTVDPEASSVATVFEVVAQDRPGLLYHLASAISRAGCNIEVVLVDTEAHKAIDVFHVMKNASPLTAEEAASLRDALLAACAAKHAAA